ncbi:MAG: helix-turn-helix transcriptional regulator [Eubacterium sp.]
MKEQTTEIFKRFGERIQYVRKTEHITLDELSKQSGLSIGQLRKWESGNSLDCPATDMYLIAKALNVDMEYLYYSEIEASIERFYLAYKLSVLPEHIQEALMKKLDEYQNQNNLSIEFWDEIIAIVADDDSELSKELQKLIRQRYDKNEP